MFDLAYRPKSFDEILSQEHLTTKDAPFRRLCESGKLTHTFFYGGAGVGKTTLARVVANEMGLPFFELNATSLKVEEIRSIIDRHKNTLQKPLIFIDEIHRLSKNQQEVLLPHMESGSILLLGASTESPFYTLTSAMRSRSLVYELHKIRASDLADLATKVATNEGFSIDDDALEYIANSSGGDARSLLRLLDLASSLDKTISLDLLKTLRPQAISSGSSQSCTHYNLTSALIKSMRGSDPDASIYYLAKLIDGGESAEFIARRMVIFASEDVGLANPNAMSIADSAMQSVKSIGYPEARIILANLAIYLASSPKSNTAYKAIDKALDMIKNGLDLGVVPHIASDAKGYKNPHDSGGIANQKYLSRDIKFIDFKDAGYEKKIKEWSKQISAYFTK
ncbi:MAG: replication-associated recombination protein A [Sulfuricurvum sp.]